MNKELKDQIITATLTYMAEKELNNNDVVKLTGINSGYLSSMLRNIYFTSVGGKEISIADKWFIKLSEAIGYEFEKTYWQLESTVQFKELITHLDSAKKTGRVKIIIGESGIGKSFTIDRFCQKNPRDTYRLKINALYKIQDIIHTMHDWWGLERTGSKLAHIQRIIEKLKEIKRNGGRPMVIMDEGENAELNLLQMLKGFFDELKDFCPVVLIGTSQLTSKMTKMKQKNKTGIPQFYRRYKAGIVHLSAMNKAQDFQPFFDRHDIDKGLRKLLLNLADNYGELNDYLEPALREADTMKVPLTEEFFRIMYNLPIN